MDMNEFLAKSGFSEQNAAQAEQNPTQAEQNPAQAENKPETPSEVAPELTEQPKPQPQAKPQPKVAPPPRAKPVEARKYNLGDAVVESLSGIGNGTSLLGAVSGAFKYGEALVNPKAAEVTGSQERAAKAGMMQGVGNPAMGTAQLGSHIMPNKGNAAAADYEIAKRQKQYQENEDVVKHPMIAGLGEMVGETAALAPAAMTAPESLAGTALLGGALGLTNPVVDNSKGNFATEKAKQAGVGAVTSLIPTAVTNTVKYALRGGKEAAQKMASNKEFWNKMGFNKEETQPSLGQISEGGLTKETGATANRIGKQEEKFQEVQEKTAQKYSPAQTKAEIGTKIRERILGEPEMETIKYRGKNIQKPTGRKVGGWLEETENKEGDLYENAYKRVGEKTKVDLSNTLRALDEITTPSPSASASTQMKIPPKIQEFKARLEEDIQNLSAGKRGTPNALTFKDVRDLRSFIGKSVKDAKLNGESPMEEAANKIYAAFSEDLRNAVAKKGPMARMAMADALEFSRAKHQKLDSFVELATGKRTPEDIFDFTMAQTKKGATQLKEIMDTMNKAQKDDMAAVSLREMGKVNNKFDPEHFYNEWNGMHSDAKDLLFGKIGTPKRKAIDYLAKLYEKMENTGEAKTGKIIERAHLGKQLINIIGYVNPGQLFGLVSNPKVLDWLAKTANKPSNSLGSAISSLTATSNKMSPEDRAEVQDYIKTLKQYEKEHGEEE
jgi:hypothetical protein